MPDSKKDYDESSSCIKEENKSLMDKPPLYPVNSNKFKGTNYDLSN